MRRVGLAAGSAFALWHAAALVFVAAPPSYLRGELVPWFQPYADALHLRGHWAFFAPDPGAGRLLRYALVGADGRRDERPFTEALRRADPAYLRLTTLSAAVDVESPALQRSVALRLCRLHAAQRPAQVELIRVAQTRVRPELIEAGRHPLEAEFLRTEALPAVDCPR
jgi:hypothetical protein